MFSMFSDIFSPEVTAAAERAYQFNNDAGNSNVCVMDPHPSVSSNLRAKINTPQAFMQTIIQESMKPKFPPPENLPCANVEIAKYRACKSPGKLACSVCKLVSYCSKNCQKTHWRLHKPDCQNPLQSETWLPAWVSEGRPPSFISNMSMSTQQELRSTFSNEFSVGFSLWGNTPAMDLINLSDNEKAKDKDFSLAFIASGDLRHVVHTIISLPNDYTGKLSIVINDHNLHIVCRNIVLLLILGNIPDEIIAADVALHFWYSAFMPVEYKTLILSVVTTFLEQGNEKILRLRIGPTSSISCIVPPEAMGTLLYFVKTSLSVGVAQGEYERVRNAPSRKDYRDRMYAGLKPPHRVAFQEYRRFGIVLPFGAINAHFNVPNQSLFSPAGEWLQTDYADPLEGWNIDQIFEAGAAHGAQSADVYGCLYFFLSDQLRKFTRRIRELDISFQLTSFDARALSRGIRDNVFSANGIPASTRFDRIHVSNILDANYIGISGVLSDWAPLLAKGETAAIIGYFMNWIALQENGRATSAGPKVLKRLLDRLLEEGKCPLADLKTRGMKSLKPSDLETMIYLSVDSMDAIYDNSEAFSTFLRNQGIDHVLSVNRLKLRKNHKLVPHRNHTAINAASQAIPLFESDESWYRHTKLLSSTWWERHIELGNA